MPEADEIRDLLHRAVEGVRPDVDALLTGTLARGRRRSRRHRVVRAAVSMGAPLVAAAAVCAVVLMTLAGPAGSARDTAQAGSSAAERLAETTSQSVANSTSAATTTGRPPSATSAGQVPLTQRSATQILMELLPADGVTANYSAQPDRADPFEIGVSLDYTRGGVTATVMVLLISPASGPFDCAGWSAPPHQTCTNTEFDDGSNLVRMQDGAGYWFARIHRGDGTLILVSEKASSPAAMSTTTSPVAAALPLSMTELVDVASSDRWQTSTDADLAGKAPQVTDTPAPEWKTAGKLPAPTS